MTTNEISYNKKLFAFLDILGFTGIVNESRGNPLLVSKIANILARSKQIAASSLNTNLNVLRVDPTQYKYRAFSDTSVISGPYTSHDDMVFLCWWIMRYQYLLWKEFRTFVRGAIAFGDIYEDEDVVFGPAFIDAYQLEKKAVWPRVLIDKSLLDKSTETERRRDFFELLAWDEDNRLAYLDYLRELLHLFIVAENHRITGERKQDFGAPVNLFKDHKQAILTQSTNALEEKNESKRKDIIKKYVELSKYHNSTIGGLRKITQDFMKNNDLLANIFEDQIALDKAKRTGVVYAPKYKAEDHPEQSDMLDIFGAVTNRLLEQRPQDILQRHRITVVGQTTHDKVARVLRALYHEAPSELSALDKALEDSVIDIKAWD